jgi:hypothetical protein
VRIVNNDFPVDFAWPIGWLPLNGKYAPATGETTQGPINYLRRKQGEEVNASHLPHPDMLTVMTVVSREDFRTILEKHMNRSSVSRALPHVDKKEAENIHARTISAVLQLKSVLAFCDKVSVSIV